MVTEKIWGNSIGANVVYGKDGSTLVPLKLNADGELVVNLEAATVNIGDVDVASIAAGSNLIGKVGIDQVTANANEVVVKSITAGSSIIGKTGIDQTTDGTTNRVVAKISQVAGENHVELLDSAGAALDKAEDAAHTSGDKGIMALGVRADAAAATAANGDYHPLLVDATGALWVQLAGVLSSAFDSIDVAKKSKGSVTTAHSAITGTATSSEIDCRGYNSLLIHWVSSATDKTWTIQVTGATGSGLTFVEWITSAGASNLYTTDISGFFIVQGIPDYIKIVATEVDDGATVTCKVQPFNM